MCDFATDRWGSLALFLLLSLPLSGCGGGGSNGGGSGGTSPTLAAAPLSASAALPDGLTATLSENTASISVGGSVIYTLALTNNTAQAITFLPVNDGTTRAPAVGGGLILVDAAGNPFPSGGMVGVPGGTIGPRTTLAPGQSVSGTYATGDVFTPAGKYAASATFAVQSSATGPIQQATAGPLTVTAQ